MSHFLRSPDSEKGSRKEWDSSGYQTKWNRGEIMTPFIKKLPIKHLITEYENGEVVSKSYSRDMEHLIGLDPNRYFVSVPGKTVVDYLWDSFIDALNMLLIQLTNPTALIRIRVMKK